MQRYLTFTILCALLLLSGVVNEVFHNPSFAQDDTGASDSDAQGDSCVGDNGRDDDDCGVGFNQSCTTYDDSLPPQLSFYAPATKVACRPGEVETGYHYTICTDSCGDTWLQGHAPDCVASGTTAAPILTQPAATRASTPTPQCEEVEAETTPGSGLQLKTLRCR